TFKSKVYNAVLYIMRIALMAILFGAGALTIIVMWNFPLIGVIAILTAIGMDLIQRFDKRNGGTDHDSDKNDDGT
ncbi:MAG TPA: hypothetical protein DC053_23450, partial [Lachnoclostridium sp.]|nr:hypothetical protein [Lachnoclostridium sp.]